jgi:hypothetical protein
MQVRVSFLNGNVLSRAGFRSGECRYTAQAGVVVVAYAAKSQLFGQFKVGLEEEAELLDRSTRLTWPSQAASLVVVVVVM